MLLQERLKKKKKILRLPIHFIYDDDDDYQFSKIYNTLNEKHVRIVCVCVYTFIYCTTSIYSLWSPPFFFYLAMAISFFSLYLFWCMNRIHVFFHFSSLLFLLYKYFHIHTQTLLQMQLMIMIMMMMNKRAYICCWKII